MTDVDIRSTYALYRPSVATVKQRFQIAFFLLFNCLNNLGINLSVVSRAVNRTEDTNRLRKLWMPHAAK